MCILHCICIDGPHPSRVIPVHVSEQDLISKVQELVFPGIDWEDGDAKRLPLYKPSLRIPIGDEGEFEKALKAMKLHRLTPACTVRQLISGQSEDNIDIVVGGV